MDLKPEDKMSFVFQVCQAKCIKCGKYGHMNTDRRCHLYGKAVDSEAPVQNLDQARLLDEMKVKINFIIFCKIK